MNVIVEHYICKLFYIYFIEVVDDKYILSNF